MRLENVDIVLGSASPRRKQLFEMLDLQVSIEPANIEEVPNLELHPSETVIDLAKQKANALSVESSKLLVCADTVVVDGNDILGKPKNEKEAIDYLQRLSDKWHSVYSGVYLSCGQQNLGFSEHTKVFFKALSATEIDYYIKNHNPFDKAGAYGIQDWMGLRAVEKIEGCFYNVMGFPVNRFLKEIEQL